ncbi:MAG: DUF429 domain-containing protein [Rhodoferax sp.]|nr:DUF429 domain-containing protein [Rhodoferax sp.]
MDVLVGCDFSSSPSARKAIVCARGTRHGGQVKLDGLDRLHSLDAFSQWLLKYPQWVGAFDLPFGLPRELVTALGWPLEWEPCMRHYAALTRDNIRALFAGFCDARAVGAKFAHRATDRPAQSSPSMKWVNPPVAWMLHAGVPRLLEVGAYLPGLQPAPATAGPLRVALEAYPGLIARAVLGKRSYKSDDKAKQTPERLIARKDLLHALETGQTRWNLRLKLSHAQRDALADDASGDSLDAVLCLVMAAWAHARHAEGHPLYGLPLDMDPLEGWIVSA